MTKRIVMAGVVLALAGPAGAGQQQADPHAGHAMEAPASKPARAVVASPALPPDAGRAAEAIKTSPRHGEYVDVKVPGSTTPITTWVVYPERKDKAGVVIVIHEIFGLTDWLRGVADQIAKDGFIAVAPDLLSGKGPKGGGSAELGEDKAREAIRTLTSQEVTNALDAVREYATKLPAASGKNAVVCFCWGGSNSFAYAAHQPALDAAVVYYGTSPEQAAMYERIKAPVLGLYGGDDARVDATIPVAVESMKKLGKTYEPHVFEGAGHGFLRQQDGRDGANLKATEQAWPLTIAFLRLHLK
jgi:carboxymethylenebutenolidase